MEKEHILSKIKRTAQANKGIPLGMDRFSEVTGIRISAWRGKFWTKWSDAQKEAGLNPNQFSKPAFGEISLIQNIVSYIRELGRFPTEPELRIKKRRDNKFPSVSAIKDNLGSKSEQIKKVLEYCRTNDDMDDVLNICLPLSNSLTSDSDDDHEEISPQKITGHVYLLKHDNVYKIGKSADVSRRYKEIKVQMPSKTEEVHVIATDDPSGIEAYWHNRFRDKRQEGEWFKLSSDDVKAFKKRRFM